MADVAFSKRYENIVKISKKLVESGKDRTGAQAQAQSIEAQFLGIASSAEEYQELCNDYVDVHSTISQSQIALDDTEAEEIFNEDGPEIGQYKWATFHTDGVTSTIYKAKPKDETASERVVALKIMTQDLLRPPHHAHREIRTLQKAKHENVIPLIESFQQSGGKLVLVFPFFRQDLENLLRTQTLTKSQSRLVLDGLFNALAYLHELNIIHRDVKPSNILLKSTNGPVYLIDFGIAWIDGDPDSEPSDHKITDVGTTCYRPPEILFGCTNYDSSFDMWSAGCVVAELVRKEHYQLFDAGDLGSELALIKSMFTILGTPNEDVWPSANSYQDWRKVKFQQFPAKEWKDILPGTDKDTMHFVQSLVCFEPTRRLSAKTALDHPFIRQYR